MKNNCKGEMDDPHSLNPLTHLSKWFITSQIIVQSISSLAKIAIVQVVLWKTNKLNFMNLKKKNWLTTYLDVVIQMFVQKFYI
jgi:hypothetical protein